MKIVAIGKKYSSSYEDGKDVFVIEATRSEILELGTFGDKKPLEPGLYIDINATISRLRQIKNLKIDDNYSSVRAELTKVVEAVKSLEGPLVTFQHDVKAISTDPQ